MESGTASSYWEANGWKIDGNCRELDNRIRRKRHIGELRGRALAAALLSPSCEPDVKRLE